MKPSAAVPIAGVSLVGLGVLVLSTLAATGSSRRLSRAFGGAADEEAVARMLASENPSGSDSLWIEQLWTQIRAVGRRTLWQTLTAGLGYGSQGGGRPVSTDKPPTARSLAFAASFLATPQPSSFPAARRFFEPATQDRVFAIAEAARRKRALGLPLSTRETRLLGYHSDAADIRRRWRADGGRYVTTIEGVEFWT